MAEPRPRFITPEGFARLRTEYDDLFGLDRPKLVETIAWAAANGDRSENGDYIYGRKKLREIDRRLSYLARAMKAAKVVDPTAQEDRSRVYFGARVMIFPADCDDDDGWKFVTIVGEDEAGATASGISWTSPIAIALRGATVGETRTVVLPSGERDYHVLEIHYPEPGEDIRLAD